MIEKMSYTTHEGLRTYEISYRVGSFGPLNTFKFTMNSKEVDFLAGWLYSGSRSDLAIMSTIPEDYNK